MLFKRSVAAYALLALSASGSVLAAPSKQGAGEEAPEGVATPTSVAIGGKETGATTPLIVSTSINRGAAAASSSSTTEDLIDTTSVVRGKASSSSSSTKLIDTTSIVRGEASTSLTTPLVDTTSINRGAAASSPSSSSSSSSKSTPAGAITPTKLAGSLTPSSSAASSVATPSVESAKNTTTAIVDNAVSSSSTKTPTTTPSAAKNITTPIVGNAVSSSSTRNATTPTPVSAAGFTTLTVLATSVRTITSCAASITNCPASVQATLPATALQTIIVTDTVMLTSTICPVTAAESISSSVLAEFTTGTLTGTIIPASNTSAISPATPAPTPARNLTSAAPVLAVNTTTPALTPTRLVANVTSAAPVFANTTLPAVKAQSTTLTVAVTSVHTVTSCAPEITNCPVNNPTSLSQLPASAVVTNVVTDTIVLTSTVCPVTAAPSISSSVMAEHSKGSLPGTTITTPAAAEALSTTLTVAVTSVHTVTSCAPEITNCPVNNPTSLSQLPASAIVTNVVTDTIVLTSTVCPVASASNISSSVMAKHTQGALQGTIIQNQITNIIIMQQTTFFGFLGSLGGICPGITRGKGSSGGFIVVGQQQSFTDFNQACNKACEIQQSQCVKLGGAGFGIDACQSQQANCKREASTATVVASATPSTITKTVTAPATVTPDLESAGASVVTITTTMVPVTATTTVAAAPAPIVTSSAAAVNAPAAPQVTTIVNGGNGGNGAVITTIINDNQQVAATTSTILPISLSVCTPVTVTMALGQATPVCGSPVTVTAQQVQTVQVNVVQNQQVALATMTMTETVYITMSGPSTPLVAPTNVPVNGTNLVAAAKNGSLPLTNTPVAPSTVVVTETASATPTQLPRWLQRRMRHGHHF